MKNRGVMFVLLALLTPIVAMATPEVTSSISLANDIFGYTEIILFITCLISIKQFFFPGEENKTLFQIFNMLFIVVYYIAAIAHIINNKSFYQGFENLIPMDCIIRYLFPKEPAIMAKRLVWVAFIINLLYVRKYGKEYFYHG